MHFMWRMLIVLLDLGGLNPDGTIRVNSLLVLITLLCHYRERNKKTRHCVSVAGAFILPTRFRWRPLCVRERAEAGYIDGQIVWHGIHL